MDIIDGVVVLTADEVDKACPRNLKWGISQVASYGIEACAESRKLRPLLRCTRLLEAAGLEFRVVLEPEAAVEPDVTVAVEPGAEPVTIEPGIPGTG